MARFLYEVEGVDKNIIGEFLGRDKELSQKVNFEFFNLFQF